VRRAAAALLLALAAPLAGAQTGAPRAIWTWEAESYAMLERPAALEDALRFFRQKHIDTVYLYADAYGGRNLLADQPQRYRRLIRRAHAAGRHVYALLGSGYLNTERYVLPAHHGAAVAMLQRVLDYNKAAAPEERFDGVNLDIEPHILDEWDSHKLQLLASFLDMSQALMDAKARSRQALDIGPAIPFWLDGIELEWHGKRKPVSEHVQGLYDYVALMDYRDHADGGDGMVAHALDELRYGEAIGKRVLLGVETSSNEIQKVSFNHLAEPDLERELAKTGQAVGNMRSFGGFVIHHYRAYRQWLGQDRHDTKKAPD
jgi:hypothetical protein